jgi:transcriptional regulator with XRE-family HTH domain
MRRAAKKQNRTPATKIGKRIRERRKARGLSQKELASKMRCQQSQVSDWEGDKNQPGASRLKLLAEHLGCKIDDILVGDKPGLVVADRDFVESIGWSGRDLLQRLRALDHEIVETLSGRSLAHNAWEAPIEKLMPVYWDNPSTWRIIFDGKKVVGYWHFNALTAEKYDRARRGRLLDRELTNLALVPMEVPGEYNIYISFMGILAKYRGLRRGFQVLLFSFLDILDELSQETGIYVRFICANSLTTDGEKLCALLGIPRIGKHQLEGVVFQDTVENMLKNLQARNASIFQKYDPLLKRYETFFAGRVYS